MDNRTESTTQPNDQAASATAAEEREGVKACPTLLTAERILASFPPTVRPIAARIANNSRTMPPLGVLWASVLAVRSREFEERAEVLRAEEKQLRDRLTARVTALRNHLAVAEKEIDATLEPVLAEASGLEAIAEQYHEIALSIRYTL